jgi:hypothetical protein
LDRGRDAIALYDEHIETSSADTKRKLDLLERKALLVDRVGHTPELIEAWKAYRDFAEPRTFEWLSGTVWLARALKKSGEHREALILFKQILTTLEEAKQDEIKLRWPWSADGGQFIMLEAAECHIALHELPAAKTLVDQAAAGIDRLRKSPHIGERQQAESWQDKVTELRSVIDNKTDRRD